MLILSRHDVEQVLTMPAAIAAVAAGFRQLAAGGVTMPQRLATPVAPHNGVHLAMPAFVAGEPGALTIKIVTVFNDNPRRGEPTIQGVVLVHEPATGKPLALMDAEHLTAMRTGAASGVATEQLARRDAATATIFGAGAQAGTQLAAVCAVRPIRRAFVFSHEALVAKRQAFHMTQKEMAQLLGVSSLSVYKWETGRVTPREAQLVRVREVLQMGVREARRQIPE